jgi:hypothetical protein
LTKCRRNRRPLRTAEKKKWRNFCSSDKNRLINYSVTIVNSVQCRDCKRFRRTKRDICILHETNEFSCRRMWLSSRSISEQQPAPGVCLANHHTFGGPPLSAFSSSAFLDGGGGGTALGGVVGTSGGRHSYVRGGAGAPLGGVTGIFGGCHSYVGAVEMTDVGPTTGCPPTRITIDGTKPTGIAV